MPSVSDGGESHSSAFVFVLFDRVPGLENRNLYILVANTGGSDPPKNDRVTLRVPQMIYVRRKTGC